MDMFCQELERQLMDQLDRPGCIKDNFVNPDVQCPPKQRGRKKKVPPASSTSEHKGRPSAAACGFSTKGMTDQEVHEELAKQRRATEAENNELAPTNPKRKRTRKNKDSDHENNEHPPAKAKRTRKSKACGHDENQETPPTNPKPKRTRKNKDADHENNEHPPAKAKRTSKSKASGHGENNEAPPTNPKRKRTRKSKDSDHENNEHPTAKAKRTSKSKASGHHENQETPPTKRTSKSTASGHDENQETRPTKRTRKSMASGHDTNDQGEEPSSTSTASHVLEAGEHVPAGPTDSQAEEHQESNGPTGSFGDVDDDRTSMVAVASEADQARAETKARYSRKSAAYHRAVKAAKNRGCTDAEAKAAGKAVSWFTYEEMIRILGGAVSCFKV